jgi:hypothetical protein
MERQPRLPLDIGLLMEAQGRLEGEARSIILGDGPPTIRHPEGVQHSSSPGCHTLKGRRSFPVRKDSKFGL